MGALWQHEARSCNERGEGRKNSGSRNGKKKGPAPLSACTWGGIIKKEKIIASLDSSKLQTRSEKPGETTTPRAPGLGREEKSVFQGWNVGKTSSH